MDFEKACKLTAHEAFPTAEVKGCYFHLCQSLVRKVVSVRLKTDSDYDIKVRIKSLAAFKFVPQNDVFYIYRTLMREFPDEDGYNDILSYFSTTYIEGQVEEILYFQLLFGITLMLRRWITKNNQLL